MRTRTSGGVRGGAGDLPLLLDCWWGGRRVLAMGIPHRGMDDDLDGSGESCYNGLSTDEPGSAAEQTKRIPSMTQQ